MEKIVQILNLAQQVTNAQDAKIVSRHGHSSKLVNKLRTSTSSKS